MGAFVAQEQMQGRRASRWPGALAIALATVVAQWAVGYFGRLPQVAPWLPPALLLAAFVAIHGLGGFWAGRALPGNAWVSGMAVGGIASLLDLLVLGSLLAEKRTEATILFLQVAGFVVAGALAGSCAGALGGRAGRLASRTPEEWLLILAVTGVAATFLLIIIGGLVTSYEAGLAVPDWPTSFQANMFLLPLSKMVGGIYYEHAHRLYGALVGIVTFAFALCTFILDRRTGVRAAVVALFLLVCLQGYMGGMRVELDAQPAASTADGESVTWTSAPPTREGERAGTTWQGKMLRIAHGVTAQLFLALYAGIAIALSRAWRSIGPCKAESARGDRGAARWLVAAGLMQLLLGALVRHLGQDPWFILHLLGAFIVLFIGVFTASRARVAPPGVPLLATLGAAVLALLLGQFVLGILAFLLGNSAPGSPWEVLFATAHQTVGAAILLCAVLLLAATHRWLTPMDVSSAVPEVRQISPLWTGTEGVDKASPPA